MLYSIENTLLTLLPDERLMGVVWHVARANNIHVFTASCAQDLIATPAFGAIIDPFLLSNLEWKSICHAYEAMQDVTMKFLLVAPSPYGASLPPFNVATMPGVLDATTLQLSILRWQANAARRSTMWNDSDKRLARLMSLLRELQNGAVRLSATARKFQTSQRTIRHDVQVLRVAGHPILGPDAGGAYRLIKNDREDSMNSQGKRNHDT